MDAKTKQLVGEFMNNPITISVKKKDVTDSIAQDVVRHGKDDKFDTLVDLLVQDNYKRVVIFGAMKHSVERLSEDLRKQGIQSESIHGNKNHTQRQRALKRFKDGQAQVLVATDVAARGIHVDNVSHVINYDLPGTFEDYVHRIGRTGRGADKGQALTFVAQ
jgi:superfamily II DNA/RNA helicase